MADPNYQSSLANDHRIFQITIDGTFTTPWEWFPTPIKNYINEGRIVLDGYIYSTDSTWRIQDVASYDSAFYEELQVREKYLLPIISWQHKCKIKSSGSSTVLIVRLVVHRGS